MKPIRLIDIVGWVALIIFIILLAWRVLGSSPTIEQLGLVFGAISVWVTFKGASGIEAINRKLDKHTNTLMSILDKVSKR